MTEKDIYKKNSVFSGLYMFVVILAYTMAFLSTTTWYQLTGNVIFGYANMATVYAVLLFSLMSIIRETAIIRRAKIIAHYGWKYYGLLISRIAIVLIGFMSIIVNYSSFETWVMITMAISSGCLEEKKSWDTPSG